MTVVTQAEYTRDMRHLAATKKWQKPRFTFLSIEPMMGPIDLTTAPRSQGQGHMRAPPVLVHDAIQNGVT